MTSYTHYATNLTISLPYSKSIYARHIVLYTVEQLRRGGDDLPSCLRPTESDPEDIWVMWELCRTIMRHRSIRDIPDEVVLLDCHESGTALRLITALAAATPGHWRIVGRGRLPIRPMQEEINLLQEIGAEITIEGEGDHTLPMHIVGHNLRPRSGTTIDTKKWRSSQFVSAILLISPLIGFDFSILRGPNEASSSYIDLTLRVLSHFGYDAEWKANIIRIAGNQQKRGDQQLMNIERDWSAASYAYQLMALHPEIEQCTLMGLQPDSHQPDAIVQHHMAPLGLQTISITGGIKIMRVANVVPSAPMVIDLNQSPDLFPTIVATLTLLHIPYTITGLRLLQYKESDRCNSMETALRALGYQLTVVHDHLSYDGTLPHPTPHSITLSGAGDHRIVMALYIAATALPHKQITITDHHAVAKSYPTFFSEMIPR